MSNDAPATRFEKAIIEFGIDAALEYFNVPEHGKDFFRKELSGSIDVGRDGEGKDWKILEGRHEYGEIHPWFENNSHGGKSCVELGCTIHSVLRVSDNVTFSVGEEIGGKHHAKVKINSFNIVKEKMMVDCIDDYFDIYWASKLSPEHSKLFTTLDNVDIFEDTEGHIFYIDMYENRWQPQSILACNFWSKEICIGNRDVAIKELKKGFTPMQKWFSTRDKAIEYVTLNKPCLSVNDVIGLPGTIPTQSAPSVVRYSVPIDDLKKLAQTKVKL